MNYGAPKLEMYAVFYFIEKPFKPGRSKNHASRGQSSLFMAEDILNGPSHDWPLDRAFGPVPLQDGSPTSYATPKRRRTQQADQRRLRAARQNH